ncbi:unnamed protein product [Rotaria sp. Silwood2]|nr:unnamed protein product [Rotaria sp. Silwood2]
MATSIRDKYSGVCIQAVVDEKYMMPIRGYENMPLVSLEEAVQPLVPILQDVQQMVYIVKQKCKNPSDGLTPDESASIMLYTMEWTPHDDSLYFALNNTLRSEDGQQKLEPWHLYLRLFLNALFRLPPHRTTAYRGVKLDLSEQYIKGKTFVWWGFSSCTTSSNVLQSDGFVGTTGTRTVFVIKCESARNIHKHSFYPSDDEILLMAATQFKVVGHLDKGDLHIVQLEETCPSFPILRPVSIVGSTSMKVIQSGK